MNTTAPQNNDVAKSPNPTNNACLVCTKDFFLFSKNFLYFFPNPKTELNKQAGKNCFDSGHCRPVTISYIDTPTHKHLFEQKKKEGN